MIEAPALEQWQRRVDLYREQQARQGPPLWETKQGWYNRWVEGNDYHHLVLPDLVQNLTPGDKVLEIGPGTGVFTISLAEDGADILCVEPSEKMRENLKMKLTRRGLSNVEILSGKVEDSLDVIQQRGPFQYTLASFSLYNVREMDQVLEKLLACSQWIYILLGIGARSSWYQELIEEFTPEDIISAPQLDLLNPLLLEMGIFADDRIFQSSQKFLYENEQDMVDYWQTRLNTLASQREDLTRALWDLAECRDGTLGIYQSRSLALVVIETQKQVQRILFPGEGIQTVHS